MLHPENTVMCEEEYRYFLNRYSFGSLITPDLQISHVPFIFSGSGVIETHLASYNPQLTSLHDQTCLLSVLGPHAYISTDSYLTKPAVPTWNYASVSITGKCRHLTPDELSLSLDKMLTFFQSELLQDKDTLPDEFREKLMTGITGIRIEVTDIKGKLKLGQHRSLSDQLTVFEQLEKSHDEGAYYARFARAWLKHFRPSVLNENSSVQ